LGAFPKRARRLRRHSLAYVMDLFPRLRERQQQVTGTLSGGEQQMLAIGRGLMARPRLLMLDEPSLGLAPFMVAELFACLRRIHAEQVTILLVEQTVHQALGIADRAYVLENGRILLANLLPRDRATVATSDSPCSWAFNDGICEAQFSALGGSPTVSGQFLRLTSRFRLV